MVKLYIGNVSSSARANDLKALFQKYGPVTECDVIKNYAFIHFTNPHDANAAIDGLDDSLFMGNTLHVELSKNQGQSRTNRTNNYNNRSDRGPVGGGYPGYPPPPLPGYNMPPPLHPVPSTAYPPGYPPPPPHYSPYPPPPPPPSNMPMFNSEQFKDYYNRYGCMPPMPPMPPQPRPRRSRSSSRSPPPRRSRRSHSRSPRRSPPPRYRGYHSPPRRERRYSRSPRR